MQIAILVIDTWVQITDVYKPVVYKPVVYTLGYNTVGTEMPGCP